MQKKSFYFNHLQRVHKTPTLAPVLFAQGNAVHGHASVDGFAHVINREEADLYGGECFHLYARGANRFGGCGATFKRTNNLSLSQFPAC